MLHSQRLHLLFIQLFLTAHSPKTALFGKDVYLLYPTKLPSAPATESITASILAAPTSFTVAA